MNPFSKITDMIDTIMDKAVKIGTAGIGIKLLLLLGAGFIIGVLRFGWHDLVYPAGQTIVQIIENFGKVTAK